MKTQIDVNGITASTSYTATVDEPCKDHAAHFGFADSDEGPADFTEEVYDELNEAWESREQGETSVTITLYGDKITLSCEVPE